MFAHRATALVGLESCLGCVSHCRARACCVGRRRRRAGRRARRVALQHHLRAVPQPGRQSRARTDQARRRQPGGHPRALRAIAGDGADFEVAAVKPTDIEDIAAYLGVRFGIPRAAARPGQRRRDRVLPQRVRPLLRDARSRTRSPSSTTARSRAGRARAVSSRCTRPPAAGLSAVCRFFIDGVRSEELALLHGVAERVHGGEGQVRLVSSRTRCSSSPLPAADGTCAAGTIPVYRAVQRRPGRRAEPPPHDGSRGAREMLAKRLDRRRARASASRCARLCERSRAVTRAFRRRRRPATARPARRGTRAPSPRAASRSSRSFPPPRTAATPR